MPLPSGEAGKIAVRVKPEKPVGIFDEYHDEPEENLRCSKTAGTLLETRHIRS
jgi:hypothetical protein